MLLRVVRDWMWLKRCEWMKRERLRRIQDEKLVEIVKYAFEKVPFYRRLYSDARVDVTSISSTRSITKLPIVTKQQVRDTPLKDRMPADVDMSSCIPRTTSGTTGMPVTVLDSPDSIARWYALWLRGFRAHEVGAFDRILVVVPGS